MTIDAVGMVDSFPTRQCFMVKIADKACVIQIFFGSWQVFCSKMISKLIARFAINQHEYKYKQKIEMALFHRHSGLKQAPKILRKKQLQLSMPASPSLLNNEFVIGEPAQKNLKLGCTSFLR